MKKQIILITLSALLPIVGNAMPMVPDSADAARIERNLQIPDSKPESSGAAVQQPTRPTGSALPKKAQKIKFHLKRIIIKGNHIFSDDELMQGFKEKLGRRVSLLQLEQFVNSISVYYRNKGYILSQAYIPPQRIKHGVFRVNVIEGFIDKAIIEGKISKSTKDILQYYGNLISSVRPLRMDKLEHYLLLANDTPGIKAKAVLKPSKKTQGAADLLLIGTEDNFNAELSIDNRGSRFVGPERTTGTANLTLPFAFGSETSFRGSSTTRSKQLSFSEIKQTIVLSPRGTSLSMNYANTLTRPGFNLAAVNMRGTAQTFAVKVSQPIIRSRRENIYVNVGLNYLNSLVTVAGAQLYDDHVRSVQIGGDWNFVDRTNGINNITLLFKEGLDALGASEPNTVNPNVFSSRAGAKPNFTKVTFQASHVRALKWVRGLGLQLMAQGQYGFTNLFSSEEFGYGGSEIGGGYDSSEITGDKGLAAKVQLNYTKLYTSVKKDVNLQANYYVYTDGGIVWNVNRATQLARETARSTGAGVNLTLPYNVSLNLEVARAITRGVTSEFNATGNGHNWRGFFKLGFVFK